MTEMEKVIENPINITDELLIETCLISKADKHGKILYANDQFCKVSGYTLSELVGQDHKKVNSGYHNKNFWKKMYNTVLVKKEIWSDTVINLSKDEELYWVKSWIKAEFDEDGQLQGYLSVRQNITEIVKAKNELDKKNGYLEHAAKILRHDMHSGINTYIPRGISSLERRLPPEVISQYKLEIPLRMLKEGLVHTQKVYKGVYEFTNMVKHGASMTRLVLNLKTVLHDYLKSTSYSNQVIIEGLPDASINESLFCTAIDNLIRNGLKYNDSPTKYVKIYFDHNTNQLIVEDNGRGMTPSEFEFLSKPYTRREDQKESGSGLGLNICVEILKEHGFAVSCKKTNQGTKIFIQL